MGTFKDLKLSEEKLKAVGMRGVSGTTIVGQAEKVKALIDGTGLLAAREGLNALLDLLESRAGAQALGAGPLYAQDDSAGNVQDKLLRLKKLIDKSQEHMAQMVADPRVIPPGSITQDKLAPDVYFNFDGGGWGDDGEPLDPHVVL